MTSIHIDFLNFEANVHQCPLHRLFTKRNRMYWSYSKCWTAQGWDGETVSSYIIAITKGEKRK